MKKLLALVLSMLLVASCFALVAVAQEETTAAEGEGTTAAADEETTEGEAPSYSNNLLVFDENAQDIKQLFSTPNGIKKTYFKDEWEGAKLLINRADDPYVFISWSNYLKSAQLEDLDSQAYPYVVFKILIDGYVDDFELFYCTGDVTMATPGMSTTTDFPCACTGEVEYIIFDLTGDCEGAYNGFRFDPTGAEEDTAIYLYEIAMFATQEEASAYAGLDKEESEPESEEVTEEKTEEESESASEEASTKVEREPKPDNKGCGGIISIGSVIAVISLGVVCIKKKD